MAKNAEKRPGNRPDAATSERGRPCAFTPETLAAAFEAYVGWLKDHPRSSFRRTKEGTVMMDVDRPMTLTGFCRYADITLETFGNYERRNEFFRLQCARIRETIETDQLEGALVGQYAQAIVARVLKLADRTEVLDKSADERISAMTDEELRAEIDKLNALPL